MKRSKKRHRNTYNHNDININTSEIASSQLYSIRNIIILVVLLFFIIIITMSKPKSKISSNKQPTHVVHDSITDTQAPIHAYTVKGETIRELPHDKKAFTQGLLFHNNILYESTGWYGESSLRKVDVKTGKVLKIHFLDEKMFGEGITVYNNSIYMLTWKENTGFVFDFNFIPTNTFTIDFEGWGLTNDNTYLIASDGSDILYYMNPKTFEIHHKLHVRYWAQNQKNEWELVALHRINELEMINNNYIVANIFGINYIAIISPRNGIVQQFIDYSHFYEHGKHPMKHDSNNVLNGIAYNSHSSQLYLTGKRWPKLIEVKLPQILK